MSGHRKILQYIMSYLTNVNKYKFFVVLRCDLFLLSTSSQSRNGSTPYHNPIPQSGGPQLPRLMTRSGVSRAKIQEFFLIKLKYKFGENPAR